MALGNFLLIVVLCFYTKYTASLFKKGKRVNVKLTNEKLDKLRKIPVKTMKQQQKFLALRYPKKDSFKFKWIMIPKLLIHLIVFFIMYRAYKYVFEYFNLDFSIPMAFLITIIFSLVFNFLLSKIGLQQQSTLTSMFGKGGNK